MTRPLSSLNLALNRLGGGEPFDPSSIANLTWWIDPDDSSTVATSGSDITSIQDKVAGTTAAQLEQRGSVNLLQTKTSGGRTWMATNAGNRMLQTNTSNLAALLPGTGEFSIYMVASPSYSGTGTNWAFFQKGFTGFYALRTRGATGELSLSGFMDENGGAVFREANSAANVLTEDGKHLIRFVRDNTANLMRIYVDGTQVASADISTLGSCDDTAQQFTIGGRAAGAGQTDFFDGDYGEILFFKDVLSASDNAALETYLAGKWGTG